MQELLTLKEAADRLGVHVSTLRAWVRSGQVPAYRVGGRFARVDWDKVLGAIQTAQRCPAGENLTSGLSRVLSDGQHSSARS